MEVTMTPQRTPEIVVRRFTENQCEITAVVADPADQQQTLYGTATREGALIGSYYCADRLTDDWHIVTRDGDHLTLDGELVNAVSEGAAILVLTTILTAPRDEVDMLLREATCPPR
jgi:hypothetical protein